MKPPSFTPRRGAWPRWDCPDGGPPDQHDAFAGCVGDATGVRRRIGGGVRVLLAAIMISCVAGCVYVPNAKPEFSTRAVLIETGPDFGDAAYARQLAVATSRAETAPQR